MPDDDRHQGSGDGDADSMTAYLSITKGEHTITGTEREAAPDQDVGGCAEIPRGRHHLRRRRRFPHPHQRQTAGWRICGNDGQHEFTIHFSAADDWSGPAQRYGTEAHGRDIFASVYRPNAMDNAWIWCRCRMDRCGYHHRETATIYQQKISDRKRLERIILLVWGDGSDQRRESTVRFEGLTDGSKQGDSVVRYISVCSVWKRVLRPHRKESPQRWRYQNIWELCHVWTTTSLIRPTWPKRWWYVVPQWGIPFHFTGLASLKIKETDRIEALKTELHKLGFVIKDKNRVWIDMGRWTLQNPQWNR